MRILHTADWQLGLRLNYIDPETAARLRSQRHDTVRRMAELARERAVDLVVVAGDVFDDNGVGRGALQQTADAIEAFGDLPVVLLAGNHDAATPESALARLRPLVPDNIIIPMQPEALDIAGAELLLCPLTTRHHRGDPTAWIPARAHDRLRIVVAHGGAQQFAEGMEDINFLRIAELLAKGVDYVALGDWHGTKQMDPRVWYSGAHEPTRFREQDPGNVLIVELQDAGTLPQVEKVAVAGTRWLRERFEFHDDADVARLAAWLQALPQKSATLLRLELTGSLSLQARDRLDQLLQDSGEALAHLRLRDQHLQVAPTDTELDALCSEPGYLSRAVQRLQALDDAQQRADALRLLYRLVQTSLARQGRTGAVTEGGPV